MGAATVSVNTKGELDADQIRITKLGKVVTWIENYGNLGTVDNPSEYVYDRMEMRWGFLDTGSPSEISPVVWFGGQTEQTVVGLAGSAHHLLGATKPSDGASSYSLLPFIEPYLYKAINEASPHALDRDLLYLDDHKHLALEGVYAATTRMNAIPQTLEFFGERLLVGKTRNRKILLVSPIYVATWFNPYADEETESHH